MSAFHWTWEWATEGCDGDAEVADTTARLALHVGPHNLMRNEDVWTRCPQDAVLASAYPLALWLASSWWRLLWEPLPADGMPFSVEWRMAHELAAAGYGFVWPQVLFATDGNQIRVWALASRPDSRQSVRYLTGLEQATSVSPDEFSREAETLITATLDRLAVRGHHRSDLRVLWDLVCADRADGKQTAYRRLEAEFGFEPDEAPEPFMERALRLLQTMGPALSEVAPAYGKGSQGPAAIEAIIRAPSLAGQPSDPRPSGSPPVSGRGSLRPWEKAVQAARGVRAALGHREGPLDDAVLYELLGIAAHDAKSWSPPAQRTKAVLAEPLGGGRYRLVPRRGHPTSRRFDLARLFSDYLWMEGTGSSWLASSDLGTARQQYQKAFAAELLCPIDALTAFLEDDYSDVAIDEAAGHFGVGPMAVNALLTNNNILVRGVGGDCGHRNALYPV
ncbi:hypothetical protein [Acidiferrobacter thiooxydans]|uniref:Uncharacterized protein n=1 Tax=Acidiferrobacter thiooxydans TaxID=163359 RepID=A0A368HDZ5_9GAMM|nr:hypothetical protein [Acidiferrobacter thiooxydans]RCN56654.1 hypothetical protein C4900_12825 [Acidiferrobacter thiooxydans]